MHNEVNERGYPEQMVPKEAPNLSRIARDTLGHLQEASGQAAQLDGVLFGIASPDEQPISPLSVESVLMFAAKVAAQLNDRLRAMNRRVGGPPSEVLQTTLCSQVGGNTVETAWTQGWAGGARP